MSVRLKLLVLVSFAVVVSVAILTTTMLGIHRRAFEATAHRLEQATVEHQAAQLGTKLDGVVSNLALLAGSTVSWAKLTAEQRNGALWLVYRQSQDFVVASLFDEQSQGVGPSAYVEAPSTDDGIAGHPLASMELLEQHVRRIPYERAVRDGKAIGEPYVVTGSEAPFVPLAVRVAGPEGRPWVIAVGVSLRRLCAELGRAGTADSRMVLLDAQQILCPGDRAGEPVDAWLGERLARADSAVAGYRHPTRGEVVLAHARTSAGWTVVTEQPASLVYASSTRMVEQSIFWAVVSLVVALVAGLLLSQSINRPIRQLVAAARQLAEGQYDVAIGVGRGDEFGRLADAFERMGRAVAERDARIRAHNEELQQRVEARTRDLEKAHEQLLQSQKLAALNSLSAGIAHEINNPLAVVLASADLLLSEARHSPNATEQVEVLDDVRRATERIRDIVARLGTLGAGQQPIKLAPVRLFALLQDTAAIFEAKLGGRTLEVVGDDDTRLPPLVGNATLLQHVVVQLLSNAVTATNEAGRIVVTCRLVGADRVEVAVQDDGRGIPAEHLDQIFDPFFTTKDAWESVGLGLTVTHRIIEKHCGTIKISSRVGEGTTVTLNLPLDGRSSAEH